MCTGEDERRDDAHEAEEEGPVGDGVGSRTDASGAGGAGQDAFRGLNGKDV